MVKDGRAVATPLSSLDKVTVSDEEKFGVFTVDEVQRLLAYCELAQDVWGVNQREPGRAKPLRFLTGPQRGLVYRFAVETALRLKVIRTIQVGQIRLDRDKNGEITGGTVRTTVGQQKTRKAHDVPLRQPLAASLAQHLVGKESRERAFPALGMYAAKMLTTDLSNAWLPLVDADELPLKFHSFRPTCATWLGEAGLDSVGITAVTGHLTRAMVDHYTHTTRRLGREAVEHLPDVAPTRKNGTDARA